jgi:hypothetical protein
MITQALCNSYKKEIIEGLHSKNHTYKMALFTSAATLNKETTGYSSTGEASGSGYSVGGKNLEGFSASLDGDTAILDFTTDPTWTSSSITARGAMIYNSSLSGKNAVAILDFGQDFVSTNGEFKVTFPSATKTKALIRIS